MAGWRSCASWRPSGRRRRVDSSSRATWASESSSNPTRENLSGGRARGVGVAALTALSTALLKKSVRGGLIIVGEINLGGSIETVHNPVNIAEIAIEKGATALLVPVACRRQMYDLSDDMATRIVIPFYSDARDALMKAMVEQK